MLGSKLFKYRLIKESGGEFGWGAHLLQDNAGVLRVAQSEQKSGVEYKGKSYFDFMMIFSTNPNRESVA